MTEHDVPVPGLPGSLEGLRVAQLSDLHLASLGHIHDRVVGEIRSRDPQLVVLTGDAIEEAASLGALKELCRALAGPGRTLLATRGNWEHWGEVPFGDLRAAYTAVGATLLGDESLAVGEGLVVVATDDGCTGHARPAAAFKDPPAGAARLLLTHAPGILDEMTPSWRYDLALCGHTHGGQATALGYPIWTPPGSGRFVAGPYTTPGGAAYVSRGIGTSILPVRFASRPELPFFRLARA